MATVLLLLLLLCVPGSTQQRQGDRIVCPKVKSTDTSMSLEKDDPNKKDFTEVSGLGFSSTCVGPSGQPLLYAVNDSGGGRRMGIFDSGTGERLISLRMPRSLPMALDYESITVGSCGVDDGDCIYVADVGDNTARGSGGDRTGHDRDAYPIYKIREPNIEDFEDNDVIPDSDVTALWFTYSHPTSPTAFADCEATFLDHVGWGDGGSVGDFYIVTKWDDYDDNTADTLNRLFLIPPEAWAEANENTSFVYSPAAVGSYDNGRDSNGLMGRQWTRAEMTLDGTLIALGDYYDQYLFLRCPGMSVAQSLAVNGTQYCETWPINYWDSQFETIAWAPDKSSTLEVSECSGNCNPDPPMVWTIMDYSFDPDNSIACPAEDDAAVEPSSPTTIDQTTSPSQVPQVSSPTSSPTVAPSLTTPSPTAAPGLPSQGPTTSADDTSTTPSDDSADTSTARGSISKSMHIIHCFIVVGTLIIWRGIIT